MSPRLRAAAGRQHRGDDRREPPRQMWVSVWTQILAAGTPTRRLEERQAQKYRSGGAGIRRRADGGYFENAEFRGRTRRIRGMGYEWMAVEEPV